MITKIEDNKYEVKFTDWTKVYVRTLKEAHTIINNL